MIAFVNGQFVEQDIAVIGIKDLSILRGYGVFDYFRISHNVPLFLNDYLDRFYASAAALRLYPVLAQHQLKQVIHELINRNNLPIAGIRLVMTGGYSPDSFEPATPNLIVIQEPMTLPTPEKFERGVRVITHEYCRDLPETKSINYLMGIHLLEEMRGKQADEVLYYHNNLLTEFPRSNVFIVNDADEVLTPANNVLKGVTRKHVLRLAADKYAALEKDITMAELNAAKEVFITSTTKRLLPVVSVNGQPVGDGKPGEITKNLLRMFVMAESQYCRERMGTAPAF